MIKHTSIHITNSTDFLIFRGIPDIPEESKDKNTRENTTEKDVRFSRDMTMLISTRNVINKFQQYESKGLAIFAGAMGTHTLFEERNNKQSSELSYQQLQC